MPTNSRTPVATDNFPGVALSASYTLAEGAFTVSGNLCTGNNTVDSYAYRNSEVYTNDQYSQTLIHTVLNTTNLYVQQIVRWSGVNGVGMGQNGYEVFTNGHAGAGNCGISKWVNDVQTTLQNIGSGAPNNGDNISIEAISNKIYAYRNTTQIGATQTDSAVTTGNPGIGAYTQGVFGSAEFGDAGISAYISMLNVMKISASYERKRSPAYLFLWPLNMQPFANEPVPDILRGVFAPGVYVRKRENVTLFVEISEEEPVNNVYNYDRRIKPFWLRNTVWTRPGARVSLGGF